MRILAAFTLLLLPLVLLAETRFVEVEVTLRRGQSTNHGIVRMIRSGTPVDVLESDTASGYTRIRMPGGTEGWILSRYLMAEPATREELVASQQRVDRLTRENRELVGERDRLSTEADVLAEELARLKNLSANTLALEEANNRFEVSAARDQKTIEDLRVENEKLSGTSSREWFLVGGGVLFFGLLLGLILPRIRWRRQRSWSDL
ncbi:MAG: TIGR04211 family SH3 domain-containing protein [Gammaproteobacteria bacterium]